MWDNFDEVLNNKSQNQGQNDNLINKKRDKINSTTTISMRVGQELKTKLHTLALKLSFKEQLIGNKQALNNIMHIVLHNMKKEYISKYKKLLIPDDFYVSFYNRKQTKGMPLPPSIELEKNMVLMSILVTKEDKELYWQLMHTYFVNEIEKKGEIVRYSVSIFLYEIVKYFEKNINKLEIIE
jgi:hypothetical protein